MKTPATAGRADGALITTAVSTTPLLPPLLACDTIRLPLLLLLPELQRLPLPLLLLLGMLLACSAP